MLNVSMDEKKSQIDNRLEITSYGNLKRLCVFVKRPELQNVL